jgi:Cdc6-like AAA superfamily ATPase
MRWRANRKECNGVSDDFLPGLGPAEPPHRVPQTDQEWFGKRFHISQLFSPTEPVREADMFVGRTEHIKRLTEGILQGGQHIAIYGERGVGKTSLVNVISNRIFSDFSRVRFFKIRCLTGNDFVSIWAKAFEGYRWADGSVAVDEIDSTLDANILLRMISRFEFDIMPVFVFDEFDRITENETKLQLAETIKLLSNEAPRATIVVVGVARTVRELLSEHESIKRAIRQILMPRMSADEIRDIVRLRIDRAEMVIDKEAIETIVWLSHGMPAFAHLLGMSAAKAAIDRKSIMITDNLVLGSLQSCLDEVDETIQESYSKATQSARPSNLYKETLLACALAIPDEFGRFTAASVRKPASRILKKPRDIPDFNRHLTAFCSEKRGVILERDGNPQNYHYKFRDPLMQSYVMMKGVKDKMLPRLNVD